VIGAIFNEIQLFEVEHKKDYQVMWAHGYENGSNMVAKSSLSRALIVIAQLLSFKVLRVLDRRECEMIRRIGPL
jgi:hypothetical protein